ncbi:hypothetical protein Tco_1502752 [Tanacetum coccineum]
MGLTVLTFRAVLVSTVCLLIFCLAVLTLLVPAARQYYLEYSQYLFVLLKKINLLIAKIEAINSNPPPSSDFVTKSPSTFLNFFLEETNTFDNSIPKSETFCFDLEENSSGSTTTRSDYSLPDYEAFYFDDDHIEEKSSGSTTTHSDISLSKYDSFIFDLSNDPFPPADRSDFYHEEFAGELAHIISPSEYDHFYFKIEPELGNFTMDVVEDIFDNPTREPRVHVPNVLPTHPTLHLDSDFTISSDSLGSDLVVSFPSGTRNKIFDPGIFIGVQSKIFLSRDAFSISFMRDPLSPVFNTLLPFSSENEDKVFNPGILASNEETYPHLLSHRGFNPLKIIFDFSKSPKMIWEGTFLSWMFRFSIFILLNQLKYGGSSQAQDSVNKNKHSWVATHAYPNIILVVDCPDYEASRARGFCPSFTQASHPQLHYGNPIS